MGIFSTALLSVQEFFYARRLPADMQTICVKIGADIAFKELAIQTAVNLISSTMAQAEFKTFSKGIEVKKQNYYLFNVQPNLNQNATEFWKKAISKLIYENKCLIVMRDDQLFIVDEWEVEEKAFKPNKYKNLKIGDLAINRGYREDEVLHLVLHNEPIKNLINSVHESYGKLLSASMKHYRRAGARRAVLEVPTKYSMTPKSQADLKDFMSTTMKDYFTSEDSALVPLTDGMKLIDNTNESYRNSISSRDVRDLVDDVFDFVALAFQIPPALLKGSVADSDKSWDNFMAFCVNAIAEVFEDEINRKMYKPEDYLDRTYMKADTTRIKVVNIRELGLTVEYLTRNGANTIDDNMRLLGREEIGGELGKTRFVTKNLTTLETMRSEEGGNA